MNEFHEFQNVKIKDSVAIEFENTIGAWDNEFKGLLGLVGYLAEPTFLDMNDWIFIAPNKRFGVSENDIEAVTL